jgi:hypothetical protein
VLKRRDEKILAAAQMKFLRHLLGTAKLDREEINPTGEKLGVQNIVLEIKQEWLQHVEKMGTDMIAQTGTKI